MLIHENILMENGASIKNFKPKEIIFEEGNLVHYYFQIHQGEVKINNYNADGTEFIHNILGDGQSLGESSLFNEKPYPTNSIAISDCKILCLPKNDFFKLLKEKPEISVAVIHYISERMYYKMIMIKNNSVKNPVEKVWTLLNYLKSFQFNKDAFSFQIRHTRQELACLTGLAVETVIRSVKILEKEHKLLIQNGKIFI